MMEVRRRTIFFTYVVNNGVEDSAPAVVLVTVNPVNDSPIANIFVENEDVIFKKAQSVDVTLDGSGSSDEEGPIATFAWDDGQGHTSGDASPTFNLGEGMYEFSLTVIDADGEIDSDDVTITVTKDRGKAVCNNPNSNKPECQSQ